MNKVSNCCGALPVGETHDDLGFCSNCREHAVFENEEVEMTIYNLLSELETTIILNPFEWTVCWGAICFFTGSYLEHLIGWFSPIKEENE